ncbi:unnamed protein product [Rotaria socialis]|uniref:Secreted protein n=1 Tax=Rotaria socialis TaxID=392032 RepID=A0A818N735_9BILA|nr:unnamed protein product [Rotaria socialis]CAF3302711.1 unnamed protein product [Rotaria socialis]CAF3322085.1 unnamed protein product [Rotaria socialis]CAF3333392.1 unnamed protein product [Rotaria socialis]CAF3600644.1 unnamed protein product [Rotaria socialis]
MNQRLVYLLIIFIAIEQVINIQIEHRFRRETVWKTTQVLNCIRRLRSIIIRPSKLDLSTEMLNCLQQTKTNKSNKKLNKT